MPDSNQFYKSASYQYQAGGRTYYTSSEAISYYHGGNSYLQKQIGNGGEDVAYSVGTLDITYTIWMEESLLSSISQYSYLSITDDLFYGVDGEIQVPIMNVIFSIDQQAANISYQIVGNELRIPMRELIPYFQGRTALGVSMVVTVYYPAPNANPLLMNSLVAAQIIGEHILSLPVSTIGGGRIVEGVLTLSKRVEYEGEYLKYNDPVSITVEIRNTAQYPYQTAVIPQGNFSMDLENSGFIFDYWITLDDRFTVEDGIITNARELVIIPGNSIIIAFVARFGI